MNRKLKMCTLKEYGLPAEIMRIEQSSRLLGGTTSKEIVAKFGPLMLDKSIESGYLKAFQTMLQFEEAAQSQFLVQFNTKEIKLSRSDSGSEREFCIKNDVSVANLSVAVPWYFCSSCSSCCCYIKLHINILMWILSIFTPSITVESGHIDWSSRRIGCGLLYIKTIQFAYLSCSNFGPNQNMQQRIHFHRNHRKRRLQLHFESSGSQLWHFLPCQSSDISIATLCLAMDCNASAVRSVHQ